MNEDQGKLILSEIMYLLSKGDFKECVDRMLTIINSGWLVPRCVLHYSLFLSIFFYIPNKEKSRVQTIDSSSGRSSSENMLSKVLQNHNPGTLSKVHLTEHQTVLVPYINMKNSCCVTAKGFDAMCISLAEEFLFGLQCEMAFVCGSNRPTMGTDLP